jgi:hypothetical protein
VTPHLLEQRADQRTYHHVVIDDQHMGVSRTYTHRPSG